MNDRKKHAKPVGTTGPVELRVAPAGPVATFQKLEFPTTKPEIEQAIVSGFLQSPEARQFFSSAVIAVIQNK
jgi:hypothetical protein